MDRHHACPVCSCHRSGAPYCGCCSALIHEWKEVLDVQLGELKTLHTANKERRDVIEEKIEARAKLNKLLVRRQGLLVRAQVIRAKTQQIQNDTAETVELCMQQEEMNRERKERIEMARNGCQANRQQTAEHRAALQSDSPPSLSSALRRLTEQIADKRRELARHLLDLYAVATINEHNSQIVNITLPNSGDYLTGQPRQHTATALGYIVQIVNLLAKYLDVTLPFRVDQRGSESLIYREDSFNRFPLFYRGTEREFRIAVEALNINIGYLCFSQGLTLSKKQLVQALPNLCRLLHGQWLGRHVPQPPGYGLEGEAPKPDDLHDWELI